MIVNLQEKCECKPIAKFGKDHGVWLGCKWCKVQEECKILCKKPKNKLLVKR